MTEEQAAELARLDTRITRLRAAGSSRAKELAAVEETRARLVATYGRGPGRPAMPPEERRHKVLLSLSGEVDLGLSVLAQARGTSRSGVVEDLVRAALVRAKPARRSRIVGASDNWIAIYENGLRRAEPARRYSSDRPFNHEELSADAVHAYGPSKADAEMRLDAELATRRPRRETK